MDPRLKPKLEVSLLHPARRPDIPRLSCLRILPSIVLAVVLAAPLCGDGAADLFRRAQKLEKGGNIVQAYLLYAQAAAAAPSNQSYRLKTTQLAPWAKRIQALASPLVAAADTADSLLDEPVPSDAAADIDTVTSFEIEQARRALPPPQLHLPSGRFDFHLSADPKEVFDQIGNRCGLQTQFDGEYDKAGPPAKIRFDVDDVDCHEALRAAEASTGSFVVPLSSKLIFVSRDTPAKRADNEQTMSAVIPVPTAVTPQDLTELAQAVRQVTDIQKIAWSAATGEILIRDRISRVIPAKALIEQLTAYRGSVYIEVRFLQMSETEMLRYGISLTNMYSFIWGGNQQIASAGAALNVVIRALEHGTRTFAVTVPQAAVVASLTQSSARTILRTGIQAVSGLPSTIHVGEKYPILTAGYFGPASASAGGRAYTPPPSFNYYDLGVSLKVLPVVCSNDLITMDLESQYQLLAGQAIDGIPILANRSLATRISIHNDEWAFIGGLIQNTDNKSVAGLPRVPLLGWIEKVQNKEKDRDQIIIVVKPHIVGEPPANRVLPAMAVGSDNRPLSPI